MLMRWDINEEMSCPMIMTMMSLEELEQGSSHRGRKAVSGCSSGHGKEDG